MNLLLFSVSNTYRNLTKNLALFQSLYERILLKVDLFKMASEFILQHIKELYKEGVSDAENEETNKYIN